MPDEKSSALPRKKQPSLFSKMLSFALFSGLLGLGYVLGVVVHGTPRDASLLAIN
jgi:hypothetical protein